MAQPVQLNDEHYVCLRGTLGAPGTRGALDYLLLSSYEKSLQALEDTQRLILLVSLAAITMGIAIVWLYVRRVTEPLEELRAHTEAIGKGDFSGRVRLNSRDEFGNLAEAFNQMTEKLRWSRDQLEATVTSLKETQAQLIQSEKLSGIGEFVAGVAHELNNPLTSVMGFSELLQHTDAPPHQKRHLEIIYKSAVRCQKIVQNLLSFARRHKPERKSVDLNTLVEASVDILAYQLRTSNIEVAPQLAAGLPRVYADAHQLQQVFVNILNNARQAIEGYRPQGRIRIATSEHNNKVRVVLQDDGPGISRQNLPRLFDPFFTTKEIGKGTGLGLSICYGIIKEHGGTITVQSDLGAGATFIMDFPAAVETDNQALNPATVNAEPELIGGNGKSVLVVDDEEAILQMVKEILQPCGYEVLTATDGQAALDAMKHRTFDLIICDWKMPGLSGREFYEQLQVIAPELAARLIFMTGDVVNDAVRDYLLRERKTALAKPFSVAEFDAVVNAAVPAS